MTKIVVAALEIPRILSATEAASQLTRLICLHDRSYQNKEIVQLPLVDGGEGTIDFVVTHTLGSFLEVEVTDACGTQIVVPVGFSGEDGKLAIIEMKRVAGVRTSGASGTTYGVGELIQDALDEGAFSVLLGLDEFIACDGGMGTAAALGVKFFDGEDKLLEMNVVKPPLEKIIRVDASDRSFQSLSSRFFIGITRSASQTTPSKELQVELERLSNIILQDCNIHTNATNLTASGVSFGLEAFFGAEIQEGMSLVLDAAGMEGTIASTNKLLVFANDLEQLENKDVQRLFKTARKNSVRIILLLATPQNMPSASGGNRENTILDMADAMYSLADMSLFQQPLRPDAGIDEIRSDLLMRMEKVIPTII